MLPLPNPPPKGQLIAELSNYYDNINSGHFVSPLPPMAFLDGPKPGDFTVGFDASGQEFDGSIEVDEAFMSSHPTYLVPPVGQNSETVLNGVLNLRPDLQFGSFAFSATVTYRIEYV